MRVALYARVSSSRQAQQQTINQQLTRLESYLREQGWQLDPEHVYRDDGHSGARLSRPGLDQLRDRAAFGALDMVVVTEPDRLARNYVHQVLLIEEFEAHGCRLQFVERPMSQDPHDQLLLQIRGAVAEYERTLIAERMRRGRQAKLRAGVLLPWTRPPYGYRLDTERPRDPTTVRLDPFEAATVAQMFAWYLEPGATLHRVAVRLSGAKVPTATGTSCWNVASVRGMLRQPAYTGTAYGNRTRVVPARQRKSALQPVGSGRSSQMRAREEWLPIPVPAIVTQEIFDQVQVKLDGNRQLGARNNTSHTYLLRALVSCGACRLGTICRTTGPDPGYGYYVCRGHTDRARRSEGRACTARYIPAGELDELVWQDLCTVLSEPAPLAEALKRAHGGLWLPQELRSRQANLATAREQLKRQQARLLDAYLAAVIEGAEFERKRRELAGRLESLGLQERQLAAMAHERLELSALAQGLEAFCSTVRDGLSGTTFAERRALVEILIDRVVVTEGEVEIRYVIPTSPDGPHRRFCHLRLDHLTR